MASRGEELFADSPSSDLPPLVLRRRDKTFRVDSPTAGKPGRSSRSSIAPAQSAHFGRRATGCRASNEFPFVSSGEDFTDGGPLHRDFITDPSGRCSLQWDSAPTNVFVVKKFRDSNISQCFMKLVAYLHEKDLKVFVERAVFSDHVISSNTSFADSFQKLNGWNPGDEDAEEVLSNIDLIICLGGDGTLLYISSLFQESVPPVLAFHLGSLGFLTPLQFDTYKESIDRVLRADESLDITLRSRLLCTINRYKKPQSSARASSTSPLSSPPASVSTSFTPNGSDTAPAAGLASRRAHMRHRQSSIITPTTKTERMLVLNEVVIDRGSSPYLSSLEVFCNDLPVTDVQGDGLIVATPTGSTAYAAAAGASMVHPSVQAMVVTPICPHSLSFRPIMVPAGVKMNVAIPLRSRGRGAVSCDGKNRQELNHGDSVTITMSIWPLPCVNSVDHIADWFNSLGKCLSWNVRQKQKALDAEEEDAIEEDVHGETQ